MTREQSETGLGAPAMNAAVSALRFFYCRTLDRPDRLPPDLHIFTSTRLPWLGDDIPSVAEYYSREQIWPATSLERIRRLFADR